MSVILVAMPDAVVALRRTDRWRAEVVMSDAPCRCIATDPWRVGRVYCGTAGRGLLRSDDAGASWRPAGPGIGPSDVTAVAVGETGAGAAGPGAVYAGTEPSAVFRSGDGGETWDELEGLLELPSSDTWSFPPRPETHHVRWIEADPTSPGRIFAAIEAGALVRYEADEGAWHDRVPGGPRDTHTLVVPAGIPGRLHSAAGDGYFESDDGGASWRRPQEGLGHRYVWGCAVDERADVVLVSAARGPMAAHSAARAESRIYRREGEEQWEAVEGGLPDPDGTTVSALAVDPSGPGVVYAANNRGVYRSSGAGASWSRLDIAWPERFAEHRVTGISVAHGW